MTNDGATILKQIEVEHPAAKVLVDLAQLQDEEVFDHTHSFFYLRLVVERLDFMKILRQV